MSDDVDYPAWRMTFPRKLLVMLQESVAAEHAALGQSVAVKRAALEDTTDPLEIANADHLEALQAFGDDYTDLHGRSEGLGKALVIIAIATLVETIMKMKAKQHGLALSARANWSDAMKALEGVNGHTLEKFDGWEHASLARELANAFKHDDGFATGGRAADLQKWAIATKGRVLEWTRHVDSVDGKVDLGSLPLEPLLDGAERFFRTPDKTL